jgi:hypothetical protein
MTIAQPFKAGMRRGQVQVPKGRLNKCACNSETLKTKPTPACRTTAPAPGTPPLSNDSPWFHDIFRRDGTLYDALEVEYIKRVTGAAQPR